MPEKHEDAAYTDRPLPLQKNATISAPSIVAINTELLELEEDSKVLEIGSGSGYQLAVLAEIVEEAVGVEIIEDLAEQSRQKLKKWPNTEIIAGEGLEAVEGHFDKILFSCSIEPNLIDKAKGKLKDSGIIVAPIRTMKGQVLKKFKGGNVTDHGQVRFVDYKSPSDSS